MNVLGLFKINWVSPGRVSNIKVPDAIPEPDAHMSHRQFGRGHVISFDGEKNYGEIGPIVEYHLDHQALRARSNEAYLTSEITRTVMDRFTTWILDKGLKLQLEPAKSVLESEGIKLDAEEYNTSVESRWSVWSGSKRASHNGMLSLNEIAKKAFKGANIGGDMLVIQRFKNNKLTVELIDGVHLGTPMGFVAPKGNRVIHGIELDINGRHVAYHVKVSFGKTKRVVAWSKSTGLRMAFLVYGSEYRLGDVRGLPIISTSLETLAKIERYKEAAVGGAEERAKVVYTIVHNQFSDGENPMNLAELFNAGGGKGKAAVPEDDNGVALADTVSATVNKAVTNMPIGSKLEALESKQELFFQEFYQTNANIICSALGIPPNVAFSMYTDSFSASRAATKDWEHTMNVKRDEFQSQFYNPILALFVHTQILNMKINAPGYLNAFNNEDWMVVASYLVARFTGSMFPHVDPLKEAKAERLKLGELFDHMPLTNLERSTELLNGGDSSSNIEQAGRELKEAKAVGLTAVEKLAIPATPAPTNEPD